MHRKKYITINENLKAGLGSGNFLSNILLFSVLLSAVFKLVEHYQSDINEELFDILELGTIVIALMFAVLNFFISIKNNKAKNDFDIKTDKSIISKAINAPVDPLYIASGYEWYHINDNYALSSFEVNKDLLLNKDKYLLSYNGEKQKLNERQKRILLKIYNDKKKNKVLLYNDPHIGLRTNILLNNNDKMILKIVKTNYYAHITSNQLIYKKIFVDDSTLFYDGWKMTLNEDYSYKNFNSSRAANMLGVSSLVVSLDGYLIISKQGKKNDSGVNELIPSSTGSVDFADIVKNRYVLNNNHKSYYLNDLIINASKRETFEEINISKEYIADAKVIGFMRMLFLGGHPEFMVLLNSSLTKDEIINNFKYNENEKQGIIRCTSGNELEKIYASVKLEDIFNNDVDELIKSKFEDQIVSIQLYMILKMVHKLHQDGLIK